MLQGTQNKPSHNLWGFSQVRGQINSGDTVIQNGINKTPFSYIKPNLEDKRSLQLARMRVGLRGSLTSDNKINYFILSEIGENGITNPINHTQNNYLTDASVTLRHLPINIRIGKFKYAGSEEGLMSRFTSPFIHFTTLSDQLMLERFIDTNPSQTVAADTYLSKPLQGVGAYRDSGVQFFQSYPLSESSFLTLSYMLGNGSGLAHKNINSNRYTHYAYLSYEDVLGKGKGYRQESYKLYGWYQDGKRKLSANSSSKLYDRIRYGVGGTYFYKKLRLEAEYMKGKGMILTGAKDIDSRVEEENWNYEIKAGVQNEADGYYIASTYEIVDKIELIARYDKYNRMTNNDVAYRKFETITTGLSYRFKGYNRIDLNYSINSIKAPYNQTANDLLKASGSLLSLQLTMVFK